MNVAEELKEKLRRIPRVRLVNLPTPLEEMPRLSKILNGPRLWIKRDDCTGMAFGGNKERKTEFVMADALNKKADVVITTGAIQSNHARATVAAARKLGLKAVLALQGAKPESCDGNLLLDYLLGAEIRFIGKNKLSWDDTRVLEEIADELMKKGHVPYIIPAGASYPVGAVSYVVALLELFTQAQDRNLKIDYVVHAAGSGGTQAGLILGNKILKSEIAIYGMCVEPERDWLLKRTVDIANGTARLLDTQASVVASEVTLIDEYAGRAYGKLTSQAANAIKLVAETEGILLDPVYTGKAMAGLVNMAKQGRFRKDDNVVFIHTGGNPALFAYKKQLVRSS